MNRSLLERARTFLRAQGKNRIRYWALRCAAVIVIFITTYMLILPAVTMERSTICGKEEHTHTEECYSPGKTERTLNCQVKSENPIIHIHDANCYDESGTLVCQLPEVREHVHTDECYTLSDSGSSGAEFSESPGDGEPVFTDGSASAENAGTNTGDDENGQKHLMCGLPEIVYHVHDADCYNGQGNLICGKPEIIRHQHTDECFTETVSQPELICGKEEHQHTEECYAPEKTEEPEVTKEPNETEEPEPTVTPEETKEPEPTEESEPTVTPEVTKEPEPTEMPEPTKEPEETKEPNETEEPEPTVTPEETEMPEETEEPEPTVTPEVTEIPEPTGTPEPAEIADRISRTEAGHIWVELPEKMQTALFSFRSYESYEDDLSSSETPVVLDEQAALAGDGGSENPSSGGDPLPQTGSLDISPYINAVYLAYQDGDNWSSIDDSTANVPADARFKITVNYGNIPLSKLIAAGGVMTYQVPDLFTSIQTDISGVILADNEVIGTINADENALVTIRLDNNWLGNQSEEAKIKGDFYVTGLVSSSELGEGGKKEIVFGSVTKTINFEENTIAKYGNLTVEKAATGEKNETSGIYSPSIIQTENGDYYLEYTLTVKTGETAMPDVTVVDDFYAESGGIGEGNSYVDSYVGVDGTESFADSSDAALGPVEIIPGTASHGTVYLANSYTSGTIPTAAGDSVSQPGVLVWKIGNMGANETRTLTYRIKLKDSYIGGKDRGTIANLADVFSKEYPRGEDKVIADTTGNAVVTKNASMFETNPETGVKTATYVVTVTADSSNSYSLDRLRLYDVINNVAGNNKYRQYVSYVPGSFELYRGNALKNAGGSDRNTLVDSDIATSENQIAIATVADSSQMTEDSKAYLMQSDSLPANFNLYLPAGLEPGNAYTIIYQVKLDPVIYGYLKQNSNYKMGNTATVYDTNSESGDGTALNSAGCTKDLGYKRWTRKIQGEKSTNAITIPIGGSDAVYTTENGTVFTAVTDKPADFTVPAENYKYTVLVNEAGDWNVSSATLKDSMSDGPGLVYSGYVQLNAYQITDPGEFSDTDAAALQKLQAQTPEQTVWLYVNDLKSFEFKPEDFGLSSQYAYVMTYYAVPKGVTGRVEVANTIGVSGPVTGPGTGEGGAQVIVLDGISVTTKQYVEGEHTFSAIKKAWYYDRFDPEWTSMGACWWYIEVTGNVLDQDARIQDIQDNNTTEAQIYGVYHSADSPGGSYNAAEYQQNNVGHELENSIYNITTDGKKTTVSFPSGYAIPDGEKLYILVRSRPLDMTGDRTSVVVQNKLTYSGDAEKTWSAITSAKIPVAANGMVFKEGYSTYTYDKATNTVKCLTTSRDRNTNTGGKYLVYKDNGITESGTYVEYGININYDGEIDGEAWVSDSLPEGLEPVYVRNYWQGNGYNTKPTPTTPDQTELDEDPDWVKYTFTAKGNNINQNTTTTYYYNPATRELRWKVIKLKRDCTGNGNPNDPKVDRLNVEYQVVCRVTDPDVLMGGERRVFTNIATVTDRNGNQRSDSADVTSFRSSISKIKDVDAIANAGRYPFRIDVNPLGEDLLTGSDELTLVDELGENLILDETTVRVTETGTNTEINGWILSVASNQSKRQVITVSKLPDKKKLTITYEAIVQAAPGETLTIVNSAYWSGYAQTSSGKVEDDSYVYIAGGSASLDTRANLVITKLDGADTSHKLEGAVFRLDELETTLSDGSVSYNNDNVIKTVTITTGIDGKAAYGLGDGEELKYNTVYRLTEITAPSGFVLDETPILFAVAQGQRDETTGNMVYPVFPKNLKVEYAKSKFSYTVYNRKDEYELPETGGAGTALIYIIGAVFVLGAAVLLALKRKYPKA